MWKCKCDVDTLLQQWLSMCVLSCLRMCCCKSLLNALFCFWFINGAQYFHTIIVNLCEEHRYIEENDIQCGIHLDLQVQSVLYGEVLEVKIKGFVPSHLVVKEEWFQMQFDRLFFYF